LENELGVKLFDRSHTPVKITPAGVFYISEIGKLRSQQNQLSFNLRHLNYDSKMMLSIGIGTNRGSIWLPLILPLLYEKYPNIHFQVIEGRDEGLAEQVALHLLDVAIIESYIHNPLLYYKDLVEETFLLITGASNILVKDLNLTGNDSDNFFEVSPKKLNDQIFICPSVKGRLNIYTQQFFSTFGITPKEILYVSNASTSYQLALKGIGVTYMCDAYKYIIRTNEHPIFLMPNGGKPARRKVFAVYSDSQPNELVSYFMECSQKVMTDL